MPPRLGCRQTQRPPASLERVQGAVWDCRPSWSRFSYGSGRRSSDFSSKRGGENQRAGSKREVMSKIPKGDWEPEVRDNHPPAACLGRARVGNRLALFSLLTLLFSGAMILETRLCQESFGAFQFSRCFLTHSPPELSPI